MRGLRFFRGPPGPKPGPKFSFLKPDPNDIGVGSGRARDFYEQANAPVYDELWSH